MPPALPAIPPNLECKVKEHEGKEYTLQCTEQPPTDQGITYPGMIIGFNGLLVAVGISVFAYTKLITKPRAIRHYQKYRQARREGDTESIDLHLDKFTKNFRNLGLAAAHSLDKEYPGMFETFKANLPKD